MARSRNIKPGFFTNDELAEIEPLGRLLFAGLWTIADREGRLEDRPKKIKIEVLPYDDCDCDKLLQELHNRGFIVRYLVNGAQYIQIVNWSKHQNPHIKETASTIPAPDKNSTCTVHVPKKERISPADSLNLIPDSGFLDTDTGYLGNNSFVPDESGTEEDEPPSPPKKHSKYTYEPEHMELAEQLKFRILDHKPNFKYPSSLEQWANTIRLMVEQDHRSPGEISSVIDWCQRDNFWQNNILSADKLREKFDQLQAKMTAVLPRGKPPDDSRLSMIENVKRRLASGNQ